ncbi:MAG: MgtC/SapB family protein [Euryarchaeota archaeon]|nr:MgtC/SapB family protein [Euryarchaeota archaeon]
MDTLDFLLKLGISMAIGGLIGLEREQHRDAETVVAGFRTYPLIAAAGFLFSFLETDGHIASAVPIGLGIFGAVSLAYIYIRHSLRHTGFTSPIAILVTFIIGILVGYGHYVEAVAVGMAVTFVLLAKGRLHEFASAVTEADMMGALQFMLVAFILYPLVLDAGPLVVNGFDVSSVVSLPTVLLTVILVSMISFLSFLAIMYFGSSKGLAFSGLMGGLVNSEAAAASLSGFGARHPAIERQALAGILLANAGMLGRNVAIAGFSDPTLRVALVLALPATVMVALSVLWAWLAQDGPPAGKRHRLRIESPFGMRPAILLGVLIAFISIVVYSIARGPWGEVGWAVYLTALLGFVSSAAVSFSVGSLAFTGQISPLVAGEIATVACLVSTLNKLLIVRATSRELAGRSWKMLAALVAAGTAAFVAVDLYLRLQLGWSG